MKSKDLSIGLLIGLIAGGVVGACIGNLFFDDTPAPQPTDPIASAAATPAVIASHAPDSPANADDQTADAWLRRYIDSFPAAPDGGPTPKIKEAIGAALKSDSPYNVGQVLSLIERMRKEDFPLVLDVLRKLGSELNNTHVFGLGPPTWVAFWQRYGELDPEGALATALTCKDLEYPNRDQLERLVLGGIAKNNPDVAAAAYLAHPDLPNRDKAVEGIIYRWSRKDASAASNWVQQNLQGEALKTALYGMAWGVSQGANIAPATALLRDLTTDEARPSVANSIKSQIKRKVEVRPDLVFEFIETTRGVGLRDVTFENQMAVRFASEDPLAAANYFAQPLQGTTENDFAQLRTVTARWARDDYKAANSWAKGEEGKPHYAVIASEFARAATERNDTVEAKRWDTVAETAPKK